MKKLTITLLLIIAVLMLMIAVRLVYIEFSSPQPVAETPEPEKTYDSALLETYKAAAEIDDYIAMNRAYDENMALTGVAFPDVEHDPTYGGKIYTYPYSFKLGDKEQIGYLYVVEKNVDRDVLSIDENDFLAADYRENRDPEFVVYDSYRADNEGLIRCLCEILLEHEEKYPTEWERSLKSMVSEWEIHNMAYAMEYRVDSAKDVNLNNKDEDTDWFERAAKELSS